MKTDERTHLGRITSVFIREDRNEIYVNVVTGPGRGARTIPFKSPAKGFWAVPEEGDIVEVYRVDREPVARFPHNSPDFSIPGDLSEGDFCLKLNEATQLRFSKQSDGTFSVRLDSDSEIVVDAPTVKLGGDSATNLVAREGDTVETSDPLTGTNTGTITSGSATTKST
jgi:hypothetical protein